MAIKTIGVLGAGVMGGGIAYQAALKGFDVILCDVEDRFVESAVKRATSLMDKNIEKQKMTVEEKESVLSRIKATTDMQAFAAADLVVEAIIENLQVKREAFEKLDRICRPDVILATNTSSMAISQIASATKRQDRFAGMHFFNPVPVMRLIELVRGVETSDETVEALREVGEALGKTVVVAKKDMPGFIVNRLLFAQFFEAARMYEEGVASLEDMDTAVKLGLNYPMGPFELMDYGSIDLAISVGDYMFNETKDPKWNPPHTLKSLVRAGRYGKKNGAGWYKYENK
ncbi:MAG: 3-hydroxyacyl-CoA dehydrogenase family protein [Clostridiales bacterium]|nr:3-hydroxyacyl-CoA dehydrogenase family protein [Clostridiales bacterium]